MNLLFSHFRAVEPTPRAGSFYWNKARSSRLLSFMTKFYIASALENADKVRDLKAALEHAGWHHTYDWTVHGSVQGESADRLAEVAMAETIGVLEADVVIALLPGGRGTHTEFGMSLGATVLALGLERIGLVNNVRRRHVIYSPTPEHDFGGDGRTCVFYHHLLVERFADLDKMIASLTTWGAL